MPFTADMAANSLLNSLLENQVKQGLVRNMLCLPYQVIIKANQKDMFFY